MLNRDVLVTKQSYAAVVMTTHLPWAGVYPDNRGDCQPLQPVRPQGGRAPMVLPLSWP